ncbi:hypothetical protein CNMCM5793_000014 [Aspergillus hiratsukae]|uniref:DNA/RNA-binding protein Kin17 WH-like domain-containing protein n=1 Tax=Aspergillus hiratsukae TaxID=1194566 RepID=A0A8H6PU85_9EURO|nr:hypothetical protein CNMCM5793_000014 [Aspergillus hiratsukae]KAF7160856.1 hypothetical protein CNMCM6106_008217 [Aspergillus hiratsukae]
MPRAEAGSTKAIANKIKARQMRDENGFKCHVQSESHVRQMLLIGEDPKKHIEEFSRDFMNNFINLLKTTHGEKKVHINQFYQQVIADKEHIHMNATKWKSLTQFAAHLGREGICRVEETEKGLFVSYIDRSPETMRRREAILKKERQDRGDEEREQQQIQEQIERARRNAEKQDEIDAEARILQRKEGEKVKLNIGFGSKTNGESKSVTSRTQSPEEKDRGSSAATPDTSAVESPAAPVEAAPQPAAPKLSMSLNNNKPKNVFAAVAKKNPLAGKKGPVLEQPKKMTEQERIMKEEMEAMERKRLRAGSGFPNAKRPKIS